MHLRLTRAIIIIALSGITQFSLAAGNFSFEDFIVSGVLRQNSDGIVIKLVHKVGRASSALDVVAEFKKEIDGKYPDYSLIEVIASPVDRQAPVCEKFTAI